MPQKKDQNSNPTRNALSIFSLLLYSGKAYTLKYLSEVYICSKQTVMRMIEQISLSHKGIIDTWIKDGERYYRIKTPPVRPRLAISEEELMNMALCRDFLQHLLPKNIRDSISGGMEKAAVLLDDYESRGRAMSPVAGSIVKGCIDYSPFAGVLDCILDAIPKRKVVELAYQSPGSPQPKTHEVVPVSLQAFRETLYLRSWSVCERGTPAPEKPLTFAIQRIKKLIPTIRTVPQDVLAALPRLDADTIFGIAQSHTPFQVTARFYGTGAVYVSERTWSEDQKLERDSEGNLLLHFTAQSEVEVVKWILSFGGEAELLEPEPLRERVEKELSAAASRYGCTTH